MTILWDFRYITANEKPRIMAYKIPVYELRDFIDYSFVKTYFALSQIMKRSYGNGQFHIKLCVCSCHDFYPVFSLFQI